MTHTEDEIRDLQGENQTQQQQIDQIFGVIREMTESIENLEASVDTAAAGARDNATKIDRIEKKILSQEDFERMLQASFDKNLADSARRVLWVAITGLVSGAVVWVVNSFSSVFKT